MVAWLKTLNTVSAAGSAGGLSWERVRDSEKEPQNWLSYWGDLGGRHFFGTQSDHAGEREKPPGKVGGADAGRWNSWSPFRL